MPRRRGFPGLHRLQGIADRAIPLHADFLPSVHTDSRAAAAHGGEFGLRDRLELGPHRPRPPAASFQNKVFGRPWGGFQGDALLKALSSTDRETPLNCPRW